MHWDTGRGSRPLPYTPTPTAGWGGSRWCRMVSRMVSRMASGGHPSLPGLWAASCPPPPCTPVPVTRRAKGARV